MTVSKTTLNKAIETVWTWPEITRLNSWNYDTLIERVAQFAESISQEVTAELQKENARLREALEKLVKSLNNYEGHDATIEMADALENAESALNPPKGGAVQKGLSKEKAK